MSALKVYIGYDPREAEGYRVAEKSLLAHASVPVSVTPLDINRITESGMLRRPVDKCQGRYDIISNAPCSTEFSISRFLTPILAQTGWALFIDCDMLFEADGTLDQRGRREKYAGQQFDLVFIDALHDYASVKQDIGLWLPLVREGGMLAGHDFNHRWPGCERAVAENFNLMRVGLAPDSVWFVLKQGDMRVL